MKKRSAVASISALLALGVLVPVAQAGVGPNARFQDGNFSHWKENTRICGSGELAEFDTFAIGFTYPPQFGGAVVSTPPGGHAAIFGSTNPAWGYVSRTFTIPRKARKLSFRVWWFNQASPVVWQRGSTLKCPTGPAAQMIYASLLKPGSSPSSLAAKDQLLNLWRPQAGISPAQSGTWRSITTPVRKLRGKRVTFRFLVYSTRSWLNAAFTGLKVR